MKIWRPQTAHALTRDGGWGPLLAEISDCLTVEAVRAWWTDFVLTRHRDYPESWTLLLRDACESREGDLMAGMHHAELDAAYRATMGTA